jgi:hypothetical protein
MEEEKSCMTALRKNTTVSYSAYIKFTVYILPRDILISFLGAHLILHITFLTFAIGMQCDVENLEVKDSLFSGLLGLY